MQRNRRHLWSGRARWRVQGRPPAPNQAVELFAEIPTPVGTLAIGSDKTVALFAEGSAEPAANRSVIIEFIVDDVDAAFERLRGRSAEIVTEPTTMPWGYRALLFRDPDGNLVNLFTPVSADARAKFGV
jgi:catechol 2,3-dioxygenase-like lactoylglutathione lyase family enzyme